MQKKTALRPRKHRKVSPPQVSGLIAQAKKPRRSARTECALDSRSHRTDLRTAKPRAASCEHTAASF